LLTVPETWLSVPFVMVAQALSGIAKDLNKMSAKASVKTLAKDSSGKLFHWVAVLTGSKNALKGGGFFIGAALLQWTGFRAALLMLAGMLFMVLLITLVMLPSGVGRMKNKPRFSQVFSRVPAINRLSAARFFLFGSRDAWFVVGLPVFLYEVLNWNFMTIGSYMAVWVIGYGFVQAGTPRLLSRYTIGGSTATRLAFLLAIFPAAIALGLQLNGATSSIVTIGLITYGIVFALNSAVHSYLILAYSDHDKVSMNVGFYYMANAGGRLTGTILSGLAYQLGGLEACLWWSAGFAILAGALSFKLPSVQHSP
jgi:predicted MFS family arabinose efflux permease